MAWFEVTFMVEADNSESFHAEFDEDRIAEALPGKLAYLVSVEEKPTISEAIRAKWEQLRRRD
jgi:hypothetical protein